MSPQIRKVVFMTALLTTVSGLRAGDLSRYRNFQLGMNLPAVEKLMDVKTAEVKTVHQRPAVIQDVECVRESYPGFEKTLDEFVSSKRVRVTTPVISSLTPAKVDEE